MDRYGIHYQHVTKAFASGGFPTVRLSKESLTKEGNSRLSPMTENVTARFNPGIFQVTVTSDEAFCPVYAA